MACTSQAPHALLPLCRQPDNSAMLAGQLQGLNMQELTPTACLDDAGPESNSLLRRASYNAIRFWTKYDPRAARASLHPYKPADGTVHHARSKQAVTRA